MSGDIQKYHQYHHCIATGEYHHYKTKESHAEST